MQRRRSDAPGQPGTNLQQWGSIRDAAAYAGVSTYVVRTWIKDGLPVARVNRRIVLIRFTDVDEFLDRFRNSSQEIQAMANDIINSIKA